MQGARALVEEVEEKTGPLRDDDLLQAVPECT